ncbi:MAG: BamA/TamA family outer membrane protein [Prevotellaceae bacterium]|nr:BamA/TamA family outer membrane protein [Prevotellaceae bacterium]
MKKLLPLGLLILASCSTTSSLENGEQLYTGLIPTEYKNYEVSAHQEATQEEVEAAIATAPNGALLGSSYYRTPFPYGLWIWNSCAHSSGVIKKWLNSTFGKPPVLMGNVNPALRSSIAKNILHNNGYFNGNVTYSIREGKAITTKKDSIPKPRTAKIQYKVDFGHLYNLDSITYNNFPDHINSVLNDNPSNLLYAGAPFSVNNLDGERNRIYGLLRNNGYYYYQKQYTTFLADTVNSPGKVLLQVRMHDSLPSITTHKWVIGKTEVQIKRQILENVTDSIHRKFLTIRFAGKKPAIRPRVILGATKLWPGALFSEKKYEESLSDLNALGVFSSVDINFKPRLEDDGTVREVQDSIVQKYGAQRAGAGILDMTINAVLDKPYDVSFTATGKGKTDGRIGPGITFGLSKRNAFHGGELLSAEVGASYEFQTGGGRTTGSSYDFNTSLSLSLPRLLAPNFMLPSRKRWYSTPSTVINVVGETIRRSGFFNRNILSANLTYVFQPTATSIHQFTPLSIIYGKTTDKTDDYLSKIEESVTSVVATADEMTPFMRYKYTYSSPLTYRRPIYWETTVTEAGNVTSLLNMAMSGKKWNERNKKLLSTPYSQFLKFETELRKTWSLHDKSSFIAHLYGGVILPYGNSSTVPYSEQFFIGGANDMRGFAMYSIGPGNVHFDNKDMGYLYQNGDMKFVFNLEYRPHLFGSLYGAIFLDAGNVWYLNNSRQRDLNALRDAYVNSANPQNVPDFGFTKHLDAGIDIGCGLRYDLDFFVIRIDWAFAIHTPYKTSSSGFFNIPKFKDAQCLNFAIGYPF